MWRKQIVGHRHISVHYFVTFPPTWIVPKSVARLQASPTAHTRSHLPKSLNYASFASGQSALIQHQLPGISHATVVFRTNKGIVESALSAYVNLHSTLHFFVSNSRSADCFCMEPLWALSCCLMRCMSLGHLHPAFVDVRKDAHQAIIEKAPLSCAITQSIVPPLSMWRLLSGGSTQVYAQPPHSSACSPLLHPSHQMAKNHHKQTWGCDTMALWRACLRWPETQAPHLCRSSVHRVRSWQVNLTFDPAMFGDELLGARVSGHHLLCTRIWVTSHKGSVHAAFASHVQVLGIIDWRAGALVQYILCSVQEFLCCYFQEGQLLLISVA